MRFYDGRELGRIGEVGLPQEVAPTSLSQIRASAQGNPALRGQPATAGKKG